jgi:hypothetical protein
MKVTGSTRFADETHVDSRARAVCNRLFAHAQLSGRAVLPNRTPESQNAVHLNGQDPRRPTPLAKASCLHVDSVATPIPPLLDGGSSSSRHLTQNDIVVLAGERGTWQVVAPVNGSRADIRRREGFDTRVVTAFLENLTIIRCANSPGCSY